MSTKDKRDRVAADLAQDATVLSLLGAREAIPTERGKGNPARGGPAPPSSSAGSLEGESSRGANLPGRGVGTSDVGVIGGAANRPFEGGFSFDKAAGEKSLGFGAAPGVDLSATAFVGGAGNGFDTWNEYGTPLSGSGGLQDLGMGAATSNVYNQLFSQGSQGSGGTGGDGQDGAIPVEPMTSAMQAFQHLNLDDEAPVTAGTAAARPVASTADLWNSDVAPVSTSAGVGWESLGMGSIGTSTPDVSDISGQLQALRTPPSAVFSLITSGDVDGLRRQLDTMAAQVIVEKDSKGDTPLHVAVRARNVAAVQALLIHKANVHGQDRAGQSAMHVAAAQGDTSSLDCLFRLGWVRRQWRGRGYCGARTATFVPIRCCVRRARDSCWPRFCLGLPPRSFLTLFLARATPLPWRSSATVEQQRRQGKDGQRARSHGRHPPALCSP